MKHLFLSLCLVGCATGPELSTTDQDVTKSGLEMSGYSCDAYESNPDLYVCSKCWTQTIGDGYGVHSYRVCTSYECRDSLDTCGEAHTSVADSTFDSDLNYWFEAESGALVAPLAKLTDYSASGAGGIGATSSGGSASYTFDAPLGGTFSLWARVIAPSGSAVDVAVDSRITTHWLLPTAAAYTWVQVPAASWTFDVGTHTLRLSGATPNIKIDRLLLTASADFVPVANTIQAESAAVVAPMQAGYTGALMNRTGYIWVPNGSSAGGVAQWQTPMSHAGTYVIWGRGSAPTSANNSFDIDATFGTHVRWDLPLTQTGSWAWSRSPAQLFLDMNSFLELWRVDTGAQLDKLVITNDPGFTMNEPPPMVYSASL